MKESAALELLPRQRVAMACPAFELLFGGAKGGGKSKYLILAPAALLEAAHRRFIDTSRPQSHVRCLVIRKNLGDLKDLIIKAQQTYPSLDPTVSYNRNDKVFTFASGATVEFHHLDGPDDHLGFHGQEIMWLGIDQGEELPYSQVSFIVANVRTADEYYKPFLAVRITANPGGRHGDWIKSRFIDPHPPGNKILEEHVENADGSKHVVTRAFIPAFLRDNPYLDADGKYEAQLRATLPEHQIRQYLDGDWNVVVGAFFAHFLRPATHFISSFPIPADWELKMGIDWGSSAPACCLWAARDQEGNVYVIDELYMPGKTGRYFGEKMAERVKARKKTWFADREVNVEDAYGLIDHQATGNYGAEGSSAAAGIADWGFRLFPANKDRATGIEQIRERLMIRGDGKPRAYIFKDRCPNLVRTIQTIRADRANNEDYDRDDEAHACDAMRFVFMDWPLDTRAKSSKEDVLWERFEKRMRERREIAASLAHDGTMTTGYE